MKFFWGIQSIKLKMDLCNSKDEAGLKSYGVGVMEVSIIKNLFSTVFGQFCSQMSGYGCPYGYYLES
jgi:hypothetical protein